MNAPTTQESTQTSDTRANAQSPNASARDTRANATRLESAKETFWFYKQSRWLWINLSFVLIASLAYIFWEPPNGNNGGTVLGYTLGGLATAAILYLMWYGIRKRSYHSSTTTLQGCLSAHVWLGLSMAIIVPLHAGFQFGINIHTLAYVLMMFVILSGIYGAINYTTLASQIAAHRGGGHAHQLLEQIQRLSKEIDRTTQDHSDAFLKLRNAYDFEIIPGVIRCIRRALVPAFSQSTVAQLLQAVPSTEHDDGIKMVGLIARKRELASRLQEDVRTLSLLKVWLWIHVPVSLALVFSVAIHIVVVFMYR